MSQPVLLSTGLVLDARMTSELLERSIASQIEFWARMGQAIEPLLQGAQALALSRARKAMPLSECMAMLDSPAERAVSAFRARAGATGTAHPDRGEWSENPGPIHSP
jgi:hypothetical protein